MTLGGWIFMIASWAVILGLFGYSMVRTLRRRPPPDNHNDERQRTSTDGADGRR
jgi:hypothetical protein